MGRTLIRGYPLGSPFLFKPYAFKVPAAGAAADTSISPAVAATEKFEVHSAYADVDSATTTVGGVSIRVGFGASAVPAVSSTAATPAVGMVIDHEGVAAGSGLHGVPGVGAPGEELRGTVQTPADGAVTINFLGRIVRA